MIKLDLIKLSLRNLFRRKGRTLLTILSVLIGTTSITMMLSLSEGIKRGNDQMVEEMGGATLLQIASQGYDMGIMPGPTGDTQAARRAPKLDKKVLEKLSALPHIAGLIPARQVDNVGLRLKDSRYDLMGAQVWSIDPQDISQLNLQLEAGNLMNAHTVGDFMLGKGTRIFSYDQKTGAFNMAHDLDPLTAEYQLDFYSGGMGPGASGGSNKIRPRAVGIFPASAPLMPMAIYTNPATAQQIYKENERLEKQNTSGFDDKDFAGNWGGDQAGSERKTAPDKRQDYDVIFIKVDDIKQVAALRDHIVEQLGLPCEGNIDMVESINKQLGQLRLILGGIGAIALLVSAIGIANTMLMSIYERRTEIGVMKVIGASVADIRQMFLLEAGSIGLFGGVAGLLLSSGLAALINLAAAGQAENLPSPDMKLCIISPQLALFAIFFAALVGLLAGYLPAKKATKVSAIEAIRGG